MIVINKEEAKLIRKYFPYVHIQRTVHKYYMEENTRAINFLKNYSETSNARSIHEHNNKQKR